MIFNSRDKVVFTKFGPEQTGEIVGSQKLIDGIPYYEIRILTPRQERNWLTHLREDDLKHVSPKTNK